MVKKRNVKTEIWHFTIEIILILASVLIFRSAWLMLDRVEVFHDFNYLIVMLIIGIIVTLISFRYLFVHKKAHNS
jgi:hypothetical protein